MIRFRVDDFGRRFVLSALFAVMASVTAFAGFAPVPKEAVKAFKVAKGKPCKTGWVFVNGKYVEPPYVVERYGTAIRINGIQVTDPLVSWEKLVMTQPESSRVTIEEAPPPEPAVEEPPEKPEETKAEEKKEDEKKEEKAKPKDKDEDDDEELEASNSATLRIKPFLVGAAKDERDPLDRLFDDDEPEEKPEKKSKKEVEEDTDEDEGDSDEEAEEPPKKPKERKNADKPAAESEPPPKSEAKPAEEANEPEKPAAKPKRPARKPSVRVALKEGATFEMNDAAKAIKEQLNARRTEINTVLLTDGFIFFGQRHDPVVVKGREAKSLKGVLPSALKENAKNARGLLSALHNAGVVSISDPVARELARHYIDYIQIQQRIEPDAEMRKIKSMMKGK